MLYFELNYRAFIYFYEVCPLLNRPEIANMQRMKNE